ncbi:hypothetical protein AB5I41_04490 [Sphingomonas sp. MMS24-JH45]
MKRMISCCRRGRAARRHRPARDRPGRCAEEGRGGEGAGAVAEQGSARARREGADRARRQGHRHCRAAGGAGRGSGEDRRRALHRRGDAPQPRGAEEPGARRHADRAEGAADDAGREPCARRRPTRRATPTSSASSR